MPKKAKHKEEIFKKCPICEVMKADDIPAKELKKIWKKHGGARHSENLEELEEEEE